jgi:hypothetical protein
MDSTEGGGWKIRSRMILFNPSGEAQAICPFCKTKVSVPVLLDKIEVPKVKQKIIINR